MGDLGRDDPIGTTGGGTVRKTMSGPPPEGWRETDYVFDMEIKTAQERNDEDYQVPTSIPGETAYNYPDGTQVRHLTSPDSTLMDVIKETGSDHYKTGGVEPWDLIHSAKLNFDEGNVVKYVCRHRKKDGITDLWKAMSYLKALAYHEYGAEL